MHPPRYLLFLCLLHVLVCVALSASDTQYREFGIPLYEDIGRDGLERGASILSLSLDDMGRPFICANDQVHVFNGLNWKAAVERAQERMLGLSLVKRGPNGRIYASYIGEWGYLYRDEQGVMQFKSLKPEGFDHPLLSQPFQRIEINSEGDLFLLGESGFVCQRENGDVFGVQTGAPTRCYFEWRGQDFLSLQEQGLFYLEGRKLVPFKFKYEGDSMPMFTRAFPLAHRVVLSSFSDGVWEFDGERVKRIPMQSDALLEAGMDDLLLLSEGYLIASVRNVGLIILDPEGREISRLSGSSDKAFSSISRMESRGDGVVWALSSHSVLKIHFPAAVTQFDQSMGLSLHWPHILRALGRMYISSPPMLYEGRYDEAGNLQGFDMMEFPEKMGEWIRSVVSSGDSLLISTRVGLWEYFPDTGEVESISDYCGAYRIHYCTGSHSGLWVVAQDNISLFEKRDGAWRQVGRVDGELPYISHLLCGEDGSVWLEGGQASVHHLSRGGPEGISMKSYGVEAGLVDQWVNLFKLRGEVLFVVNNQVMRFDEEREQFVFSADLSKDLMVFGERSQRPVEMPDGSVVIPHEKGITQVVPDEDGGYRPGKTKFELLSALNMLLTPDEGGKLWVTTASEVFQVDTMMRPPLSGLQRPRVMRVALGTGKDLRVLYSNDPMHVVPEEERLWPFEKKVLEFSFFTSDFHLRAPVWHQYKLEGLSDNWSEPFPERHLSFSNLSEGDYVLKLRAVDDLKRVGSECEFSFTVLPPFYRTLWAYAVYVLVFCFILYVLARLLLHRHEREKRRLQGLVDAQTSALRSALTDARKANEAKGMFLANMSHEIRTPLNAVLGLTHVLGKTPLNDAQLDHVKTIRESGEGLMNVINDILDFSKLDAGQWKPEHVKTCLCDVVGGVVNLFQERAESKGIELNYKVMPEAAHPFLSDPLRLKQVIMNLVSNAVKFTKHGEVFLSVYPVMAGRHAGRYVSR